MQKIVIVSVLNVLEDPRIFYKMILSLKRKGYNVAYMVKSEKKKPFEKDSVRIVPIPIVRSIIIRFLFLHWLVLWKVIRGKYTVIQFNNPELIFMGFLLKNVFKKKVIFDVHENFLGSFIDKNWIPLVFRKILIKIYPALERFLIKNYDAIILAESSYRKYYGKRAVEILNYPILPDIAVREKSFEKISTLIYVGGIMENRRIWELIKIFAIIRKEFEDIVLLLVGPFAPVDLEDKVRSEISRMKLERNIKILGRKPLPEVYDLINHSDFGFSLLKPIGNYYESLSTKIFDYMIMGVPFAVSDFPIYNKYVVEAKTGIVVKEEFIFETANKIIELFKDREKMKHMSRNGHFYAVQKWNWKFEEIKLLKIYERLL